MTEQIIRNNIARALHALIDVEANVTWGVDEYFETWGDLAFPWVDGGILTLHPNSALAEEERAVLTPLVDKLNAAWTACAEMSAHAFLQSPWPSQIKELADEAYGVMATRGCFSETIEEAEPSQRF